MQFFLIKSSRASSSYANIINCHNNIKAVISHSFDKLLNPNTLVVITYI